ncbi:MAG: tryptophan synthase subunit alpha [Chitinophagaceae bacterium]
MPMRLKKLFQDKMKDILNIYCTAGFPTLDSTLKVMGSLQLNGADLIEIGMPFSDPLADGPVIQNSSAVALQNGMTIEILFEQLQNMRKKIDIPVVLMGYLNPILQFGFENFCIHAKAVGIDGLIIPDLPDIEFERTYRAIIQQNKLEFIFLVTPETSEERIRKLDELSSGFLYAVTESGTTGSENKKLNAMNFLERLQGMNLKNPVLAGFGIHDKNSFNEVCRFTNGAIIGSAYIKALKTDETIDSDTEHFLQSIVN